MEKDIHYRKNSLKREIERLNSLENVSENDKKVILRFIDKCFAKGLAPGTIVNLLGGLRTLSPMLGKDFEKANKEDIERLVKNIEISKYSQSTKRLRKIAIKQFYKWLK